MTSIDEKPHVLHSVSGQVEFEQADGELVYIGVGGMLVHVESEFVEGTELRMIRVAISGYPGVFHVAGRVVGNFIGLCAIMFLREPEGLQDFLNTRFGDERFGEA